LFVGGFSFDIGSEQDKEFAKEYHNNKVSAKVVTRGGPAFKPANFSLNEWVSNIDRYSS
jgi:hypothetical protein